MQDATPRRRERASWFFSQPYLLMANTSMLEAQDLGAKGLGLIAKKAIPRRNVVCYYPAVCRKVVHDDDATYAVQILTENGTPLKKQVCDIPLNSDAHQLTPRWRNKPVLGHLINEARNGELVNASIVFPADNRPRDGTLYYVPIVATRDIDANDEVRLDYGPYYERSDYTAAAAGDMQNDHMPLANMLLPLL